MKDDIPEPFKIIAKENRINEAMRLAEGNIKHLDMYLTSEDKELIRKRMSGEIYKEEFLKMVYERCKS